METIGANHRRPYEYSHIKAQTVSPNPDWLLGPGGPERPWIPCAGQAFGRTALALEGGLERVEGMTPASRA